MIPFLSSSLGGLHLTRIEVDDCVSAMTSRGGPDGSGDNRKEFVPDVNALPLNRK